MLVMAIVLIACALLMIVGYEFRFVWKKSEMGEYSKSFF